MRIRSTAAAGLLVTAALSFTFTGTANAAPDRDCPDFPSRAAAQAAYDAVPRDPERLDRDGDGQACENYEYASASGSTSTGSATGGQVSTTPVGSIAAGDGSSSDETGALHYVLGGLAFAGAGGAAMAARRRSRATV
jgi:hypothetical protein